MKAQLPRYQRLIPRPGQAHVAASPVAAVGGIMPPQQGMPQQQPGMRHPMHGREVLLVFFLLLFSKAVFLHHHTVLSVPFPGQYGAPPQGMPSYMPGGMPPYGQGPPMVPPFQGGTHMGMRPPAMSPAGRY